MANWWEKYPLASESGGTATASGDWWSAFPLADETDSQKLGEIDPGLASPPADLSEATPEFQASMRELQREMEESAAIANDPMTQAVGEESWRREQVDAYIGELPPDATLLERLNFARRKELITGEPIQRDRTTGEPVSGVSNPVPLLKEAYEQETDPVEKSKLWRKYDSARRSDEVARTRLAAERQQMIERGIGPEQLLMEERNKLEQDPLNRLINAPILRGAMTGVSNAAQGIGEAALRLLPGEGDASELADRLGRNRASEGQYQAYLDEKQGAAAALPNQVTQMTGEYLPLAAAGVPAPLQVAGKGMNDAYLQSDDHGYAIASGVMQGALTYAGGKLAGGTFIDMLSGKVAGKALGPMLKGFGMESVEELGQLYGQAMLDQGFGVGDGRMPTTKEALWTLAVVAGARGVGTAMSGGIEDQAADDQARKFAQFMAKSRPSRKDAEQIGFDHIARTFTERSRLADEVLVETAKKVSTDWVRTNPGSTAVEGEIVEDSPASTYKVAYGEADEKILGELTKRLKRKLRATGFRPDEMGVTVDNFQEWYRARGYERFHPGVRTVDVKTNAPEPPAVDPVVEPEPEPAVNPPGPTTPQGPVQMATGIPISKATRRWFQQNFTSKGEANKPMVDAAFRRDGRIRGHVKEASQNSIDLEKAVRKEYGIPFRSQIPDTISQNLNEALADPAVMATLPQSVAVPLTQMRDHIDAISQVVASLPDIGPELQLSIQQNLGKYVTRTYKKFGQNPQAWMEKALADPQIMSDFAADVRTTSPNATDDEIYQLAQILLQRNTASLGDVGFPAGAATRKYTDVLKSRKDLSKAVRQLYGENTDAFTNYAETIGKLASLTAHRQFVDEVLQAGLQQGFVSPVNQPAPGHTKEVNHQQIRQLKPLEGYVMPEELADSLNSAYTISKPGWGLRMALKLSGAAKASATVLSWQATIRNLTGNIPIAIANGAFNPADFAKSSKAIWWQDMLNKGDAQAKAEIVDLNRLGLMEDTSVSELNSMARDVSDNVQSYIAGINPENHFKRATRGVSRFYQSMDSVWKVHTFYNYLPKYRAANPNMTEPELREHVAKIVRDITPTYSEASKAAKFVSRYFPLGPFAMFSAEMWRTTANRVRLSMEEIKSGNPELAKIGYQRMAGQAAVLGATTAAAMTAKALLGMDDEDEEAMRQRVAPWQRNSVMIPLSIDRENGQVEFFDASYNDPFSIFSEPAMALLRGKPEEAAASVAEPFTSEDIAYGTIISLLRGTDENNRPIYDQGLSPEEQNKQIAKYVAGKFLPGTLKSIDRIRKGLSEETSASGRKYGAGNEALSAIAGVKLDTLDRAQSDYFRNRDFNRRVQDSGSAIRRAFLQRGTIDLADLEQTYQSADAARRKAMTEWRQYVNGSIKLGEQNPYAKVVSDVGSESDIVKSMYTGNYVPYQFRKADLAKMLQLPDGAARVELWQRLNAEATSEPVATPVQPGSPAG